MPPTPTSLVSPTHPLLSVPQSGGGSAGSGSAASEGGEDLDPADGPMISYGLVEAIFKRPESYASVSRSRGRDSRASGRDLKSRTSDTSGSVNEGRASGAPSMGTRSPTESSSASGQEFAEAEHAYGVSSGIVGAYDERGRGRDSSRVIYESGSGSIHVSKDLVTHEIEAMQEGEGERQDDDDVPTPGQERASHVVAEGQNPSSNDDQLDGANAPGVQVFY